MLLLEVVEACLHLAEQSEGVLVLGLELSQAAAAVCV